MERACINDGGLRPHLLRVGAATAYAKYPEEGEFLAEYMGLWHSNTVDYYIHVGKHRLE